MPRVRHLAYTADGIEGFDGAKRVDVCTHGIPSRNTCAVRTTSQVCKRAAMPPRLHTQMRVFEEREVLRGYVSRWLCANLAETHYVSYGERGGMEEVAPRARRRWAASSGVSQPASGCAAQRPHAASTCMVSKLGCVRQAAGGALPAPHATSLLLGTTC
jgi:hypothetical protein